MAEHERMIQPRCDAIQKRLAYQRNIDKVVARQMREYQAKNIEVQVVRGDHDGAAQI